jgi:hypothetical protein
MRKLLFVVAGVSICGGSSGALAQGSKGIPEPEPSVPAVESASESGARRDGFVIGLGVVGGRVLNIDCADCYTSGAFGMDFRVGKMLTPRFALMLDTHAVAWGQSDVDALGASATATVQGVAAGAVQWWPGRRWWVQGGIGVGEIRGVESTVTVVGSEADELEPATGFGTTVAVGYEVYQGKVFALDLNARYAGIHIEGSGRASLLVGVGLAWYP